MNSHGIGNVSNSVHSNDNRVGVPNVFVRRWSLEAPSLEEARGEGALLATAPGAPTTSSPTLAAASGTSRPRPPRPRSPDHTAAGFMAHTNHYVAPEMAPFEGPQHRGVAQSGSPRPSGCSPKASPRGDDPVELVARVLRGHEPSPDECICGHPDETRRWPSRVMTVGSMICDLDERRLYACAGPPCENAYQVFTM